jgi:hypothetical protein
MTCVCVCCVHRNHRPPTAIMLMMRFTFPHLVVVGTHPLINYLLVLLSTTTKLVSLEQSWPVVAFKPVARANQILLFSISVVQSSFYIAIPIALWGCRWFFCRIGYLHMSVSVSVSTLQSVAVACRAACLSLSASFHSACPYYVLSCYYCLVVTRDACQPVPRTSDFWMHAPGLHSLFNLICFRTRNHASFWHVHCT